MGKLTDPAAWAALAALGAQQAHQAAKAPNTSETILMIPAPPQRAHGKR